MRSSDNILKRLQADNLIKLPLFPVGSFSGILIIPTKSSVGTRERRIDRILIASPFPVWISCGNTFIFLRNKHSVDVKVVRMIFAFFPVFVFLIANHFTPT